MGIAPEKTRQLPSRFSYLLHTPPGEQRRSERFFPPGSTVTGSMVLRLWCSAQLRVRFDFAHRYHVAGQELPVSAFDDTNCISLESLFASAVRSRERFW